MARSILRAKQAHNNNSRWEKSQQKRKMRLVTDSLLISLSVVVCVCVHLLCFVVVIVWVWRTVKSRIIMVSMTLLALLSVGVVVLAGITAAGANDDDRLLEESSPVLTLTLNVTGNGMHRSACVF